MNPLTVICAWCRCLLVRGEPDSPISYGICVPCQGVLEQAQIRRHAAARAIAARN